MLKTKNVAISGILSFVFSFLISIVSTHKFGSSVLRGIIFALIFCVLSVIIQVVYDKFLSDGTEINMSGESKRGDKTGSVVDITIDDVPLERDDNGPQFFVANNKLKIEDETGKSSEESGKNESIITDVGEDMKNIPQTGSDKIRRQEEKLRDSFSTEQKNESSNFKPAALNKLSEAAKVQPVESKPSVKQFTESSGSEEEQIDSLPEMNSVIELEAADEGQSDLIRDSEFASEGKVNKSKEILDSGQFNSNAETMAKAIQTLLKRE